MILALRFSMAPRVLAVQVETDVRPHDGCRLQEEISHPNIGVNEIAYRTSSVRRQADMSNWHRVYGTWKLPLNFRVYTS